MTEKEWDNFVDGTPVVLNDFGSSHTEYIHQRAFLSDIVYYETKKDPDDWLKINDNETGNPEHGWPYERFDIVYYDKPNYDLYKTLGMEVIDD